MTTPAPLRVIQVGAGAMGRNWLRTIDASPDVELVGVADLDVDLARSSLDALGIRAEVAGSLGELIDRVDAEAVIDVTVPVAHTAVNLEALFAGLPVLCEKPAAPTVADALVQAAAAQATGRLLMISQSRRYYASLARFRDAIGEVGGAGVLTTEFFRGPHFGGFREEMAHPLLVDMAVHSFDAARYLLDAEPVSVFCEAWNPAWSWFAGDAAASAVFRFDDGTRYQYTGSWVAGGLETSWNGAWRASGRDGSATWDGEHRVRSSVSGETDVAPGAAEEIAGALAEFVGAVRSGAEPSGAIGSNIRSLAMVEAAVESAETGRRIEIADLLARARSAAAELAPRDEVRAALEGAGAPRASA